MLLKDIERAIHILHFLLIHPHTPFDRFTFDGAHVNKNSIFSANEEETKALKEYLQQLIDQLASTEIKKNDRLLAVLFIHLQNLLHQKPSLLLDPMVGLDVSALQRWMRLEINATKYSHVDSRNRFKQSIQKKQLVEIQYNMRTGLYALPEKDRSSKHRNDRLTMFFSTQWERFKSFWSMLFEAIGVHVFEASRYFEHEYLDSDIYANDLPVNFRNKATKTATHYWIGLASNFISIPIMDGKSLNILTDPIEGDLNSLLYPRMTREKSLIDGEGNNLLPKVDVVVISHDQQNHVDYKTLQKLLKQQPLMVVPEGIEDQFYRWGFTNVIGTKWWEQVEIKDNQQVSLLKITAVPSRYSSDTAQPQKSSVNGYVLESSFLEGDIYYAGDTAFTEESIRETIVNSFNIKTSIQPGGPDKENDVLESSQQSPADALLIHFKIISRKHLEHMTLMDFIKAIEDVKTIYNPISTFRLGKLKLRDSYYSVQRMIRAFVEGESWRKEHLSPNELHVYQRIKEIAKPLKFTDAAELTDLQIAQLLKHGISLPKIGQRQMVRQTLSFDFDDVHHQERNLITNSRALVEFDAITKHYIDSTAEIPHPKQLILKLISSYLAPWHGFLTRHYRHLTPMISQLKDCQSSDDLLFVLNKMDEHLGTRNEAGHMQSLIHYAKWVLHMNPGAINQNWAFTAKFKDFFACQTVRDLVDKEITNPGSSMIKNPRKAKQDAFQMLAYKLSKSKDDVASYREVITDWKKQAVNDQGTTIDTLIRLNRSTLFKAQETYSQKTVKRIEHELGLHAGR